ncbi:MAG: co-chaperone GroES [Candidatus Omnitrophica bacterium CG11_big_fil_rev_8_21_14_0_20_45_26]|uniref:Co-chaperonin GroES n=1 Tax=Candidatus Abzuiibacterium crystallinum TaxID=1974748 RepID=A0A2H0LQQ2_9BACT|nr:MAG: co-chaperone GroES [Candidatus Omnitrophica bacterium CG11_big_fil_rev_8_21_14_0_20_45_26]PIW64390.1 MAG: co-chaperone GroES [Candidatus Omnitrophica bacterium CG12_big_fil_rev_8_21_14_0_65_45_16]
MKIKPLGDRILVEVLEAEEKTKGGIILPDTAKEEKSEGKVLAVGSGKMLDSGKLQPLEVKKGDRVIFGKYSGDEIVIDGKKHKIIRENEVLAIFE